MTKQEKLTQAQLARKMADMDHDEALRQRDAAEARRVQALGRWNEANARLVAARDLPDDYEGE